MVSLTSELANSLLEYREGTLYWKVRGDPRWDKVNGGNPISYNCNGYLQASIKGKRYAVHRLVWLMLKGYWPSGQIDHINRNPLDNRIENLREATQTQNNGNTRTPRHNTSGFKGVGFHKATGKWRAYISKGDVHKSLGYYNTKEEAAEAYRQAAIDYFGEFYNERD